MYFTASGLPGKCCRFSKSFSSEKTQLCLHIGDVVPLRVQVSRDFSVWYHIFLISILSFLSYRSRSYNVQDYTKLKSKFRDSPGFLQSTSISWSRICGSVGVTFATYTYFFRFSFFFFFFFPCRPGRRQLSKVFINFSGQYVAWILPDITTRLFSEDILTPEGGSLFVANFFAKLFFPKNF